MNTTPRIPEQDATVLENQVMQDPQTATVPPMAQQTAQPQAEYASVEQDDGNNMESATEAYPVKKQSALVMPAAAAGAGVVTGAGGMLMVNALTPSASAAGQDKLTLAELMTDGDVTVAHNVTDDMTFAEAFAAARSEAGAGGVFTWRGNVYSTYTEAEWNAMSSDEQNIYARHFNWGGVDNLHSDTNTEIEEVTVDDQSVRTVVIGHDDESGADYAVVAADDRAAVLVDVDADGTMDYMAMDVNEDGMITPEEVMDLQQEGLEITADDVISAVDDDTIIDA